MQSQAMLQVFLNIAEFGMPVQQAIEAPRIRAGASRIRSRRTAIIRRVSTSRILFAEPTVDALKALGHDVDVWPQFPGQNGGVCAVMRIPRPDNNTRAPIPDGKATPERGKNSRSTLRASSVRGGGRP